MIKEVLKNSIVKAASTCYYRTGSLPQPILEAD